MAFYGGKELARTFRTVRNNTIQIAEEIPENQYSYRAAPDTMSVAELIAHIAISHSFQTHAYTNHVTDLATVNFPELVQAYVAQEKKPRSKAELVALLRSEGEKVAKMLESVSDASLVEHVKMPPGADPASKSRFEMLSSIKEHEMHHRGQLMLMQRMLGIVPHLTRARQQRMAAQQPQR
jgi:uncharacterized damage-inducible protein DinB